jgi:hypothetical protein
VQGSETQWHKNVLQNPSIRIDARGIEAEFRAMPITETKSVKSVVEKFREKYGVRGREEALLEIQCRGCDRIGVINNAQACCSV